MDRTTLAYRGASLLGVRAISGLVFCRWRLSAAGVIYFLSAAISCIISLMYIDIHCITLLYLMLYIYILFLSSAVLLYLMVL